MKHINRSVFLGAIFLFFFILSAKAQVVSEDSLKHLKKSLKKKEFRMFSFDTKIELVQMLQLWDVATLTNSGTNGTESRNDIYIRRGRTGVKGSVNDNISYVFILAYDGIGRDKNTAGNGNVNMNDNREVYLWDGFFTWNYKPMLNITAGYFRPQIGKENITAAFKVNSFEKALTNFQPRIHLLSRNTGRETGLNIGGLYLGKGWSFNYNIGYFDITSDKIIGTGKRWSPLLASRFAFTLGDPEMNNYRINYTQSYYGKRNGITLAINNSYTGPTEVFKQNSFYGADILANYRNWDFSAEYDFLSRSSIISTDSSTNTQSTTDKVYSLRLGYNFILKNGKIIQIAGMYTGQLAQDYGIDSGINSLTKATDLELFDVGLNYLINKDNLKLNLHYVWGKRKQNMKDPEYSYIGLGMQWVL